MEAAPTPTIRSRLTLLVLAAIILAFALAATLIFLNYRDEQTRLQRDSIATSRAMVQAVDRELSSLELAARVLATSPHLQSGDLTAFYDQAKNIVEQNIGHNIVLSDCAGQQQLNTLRPFGDELPHHGNLDQLHVVCETGRSVISNVYLGGVLRRPVVSIDVPVMHDGKVVYDLSIGVLPERFAKLLRDEQLPQGWIATVFDSTGAIASRTHQMDRFLGQKGSPALVRRMGQVSEGTLQTTTVEGIPVLSAFSRSGASNWAVAIGIPSADLTRQLWGSLIWIIGGLALLLLLSVWLAWRISEQISRAIHGLIAPALELGLGKVVTVPSLRFREADEVGQALVRASRMLLDAEHRANHDSLTNLPNRDLFNEIAIQQLAACQRERIGLAVLYVDLDGFKSVNDRYGHSVGDDLLCAVASRLTNAIRGSDLVARLGGDEFVVLLIGVEPKDAKAVAHNLIGLLSRPFAVGALTLQISASIGVAVYPSAGDSIPILLSRADAAMYKAKKAGKQQAAIADAA
jgi:diguanylate cyclase (GGDEF)-like protein